MVTRVLVAVVGTSIRSLVDRSFVFHLRCYRNAGECQASLLRNVQSRHIVLTVNSLLYSTGIIIVGNV